ncbi:hypothetical protein E2C01_059489 [Portunus trituberculatus]|uniref:Uncharacterized protein n=1 Tax=Portunus trituberculatus TaxID=210409 RepID=A0A5B7H6U6_PORTR|nr:hypothetical protein [Portunus trituberculatus]
MEIRVRLAWWGLAGSHTVRDYLKNYISPDPLISVKGGACITNLGFLGDVIRAPCRGFHRQQRQDNE